MSGSELGANIKGIGLILCIAALLIGVGQVIGARNTASSMEGTPAPARVERAATGSCIVGFKNSSCFELTLSVHPPGQAVFTTKLDVNIPDKWSSRVQPASWVLVVMDREDPSKVGLDLDAFELPPPQPAAAAKASP